MSSKCFHITFFQILIVTTIFLILNYLGIKIYWPWINNWPTWPMNSWIFLPLNNFISLFTRYRHTLWSKRITVIRVITMLHFINSFGRNEYQASCNTPYFGGSRNNKNLTLQKISHVTGFAEILNWLKKSTYVYKIHNISFTYYCMYMYICKGYNI